MRSSNCARAPWPKADGTICTEDEQILTEIGDWLAINGEAIYATRPWKVFGEGPTEVVAGGFSDTKRKPFTAKDIRFTTKGEALYAITLGEPKQSVAITSLGRSAGLERRKVKRVELLGRRGPCVFRQADGALQIDLPASLPTRHASAFKITFA